jgi:hypothetical protein
MTLNRQAVVPNGVDASLDPMQATNSHPVGDLLSRQTERKQLGT